MKSVRQTFTVTTRDVDGRTTRTYKTAAAAIARFTEMSGITPDDAIDFILPPEQLTKRTFAERGYITHVSDFGCVVSIRSIYKFEAAPAADADPTDDEDEYPELPRRAKQAPQDIEEDMPF